MPALIRWHCFIFSLIWSLALLGSLLHVFVRKSSPTDINQSQGRSHEKSLLDMPQIARLFFISPTPTLMAFTGVTNALGPSPQPTACRSPSCSVATGTWSKPGLRQCLNLPHLRSLGWIGGWTNHVPTYLGQSLHLYSQWWSNLAIFTSLVS